MIDWLSLSWVAMVDRFSLIKKKWLTDCHSAKQQWLPHCHSAEEQWLTHCRSAEQQWLPDCHSAMKPKLTGYHSTEQQWLTDCHLAKKHDWPIVTQLSSNGHSAEEQRLTTKKFVPAAKHIIWLFCYNRRLRRIYCIYVVLSFSWE